MVELKNKEVKIANIQRYENEAGIYDELHTEIFNTYEQRRLNDTLKNILTESKGKWCLDIGCGTGNVTLKETNYLKYIIGIDISQKMLLKLKEKSLRLRINNVYLIRADVDYLPFKHKLFDFVSMFSVLHHIPDVESALQEAGRVVKNTGGILYIDHEPASSIRYWRKIENIIIRPLRILRKCISSTKSTSLINSSKTDVHVFTGFDPINLKSILTNIGFRNIKISKYNLLVPLNEYFPLEMRKKFYGIFYFLDRILTGLFRNKFTRTVSIIAKK